MNLFHRELSQPKHYMQGTHRLRAPAETMRAYAGWMPSLGITRLANVTGLDFVGIPVFMAVRPNARSLTVSQGKGVDADAARVSALMESIELWHAEHIDAPLRHESFAALRRVARVVQVERLPLARGRAVDPSAPTEWIRGFDLVRGEDVWVPFEIVSMNLVGQRAEYTFSGGSNGLASGNHVLEAVSHALCELIERDAFTLWAAQPPAALEATKIDLSTATEPTVASLLARYAACGMQVALWDMTQDLNVPAYACAILEDADRPLWRRLGASWGYGCHLSPSVAVSRALTEAAQSRLTMIAGSRDDNPLHVYRIEQSRAASEDARAAFFAADGRLPLGRRPDRTTDLFEGDVAVLLEALQDRGIDEVAVVDLSRSEIGIPVVKVVVPGLEGFSLAPDYQPGERARARTAAAGGGLCQ